MILGGGTFIYFYVKFIFQKDFTNKDSERVKIVSNENDFLYLESILDLKLPLYYKNTLLNYPFAYNSIGSEMLPKNESEILNLNDKKVVKNIRENGVYCIGSDAGEEIYFIKPQDRYDQVYVYDIETGNVSIFTSDWAGYLQKIKDIDSLTDK